MGDLTLGAFVELLGSLSATGLFVVFIWLLLRGVIVIGRTYDEALKECDERYDDMLREKNAQIAALTAQRDKWEDLALRSVNVAGRTVELAEEVKRR